MMPVIPAPDAPQPRQHKRSMQALALTLVLALPVAFLAWGSYLLTPLGLAPDSTRGEVVSEDLDQAQTEARLAAEQAAAEAARAERQAAQSISVPAYDAGAVFTPGPGQSVVSITADDGLAGAARLGEILSASNLAGTFYVNSGLLDLPGYLSLRQAKELALAGHEVGGHTFSHKELVGLDPQEAAREICQDRTNLLAMGFNATNFAYPFASGNDGVERQVAGCGYNSARALGDTLSDGCLQCPPAEDLLPADPYVLKAPAQVESDWTMEDLQSAVLQAPPGGWTILTFHGMCPIECGTINVDEQLVEDFTAWLAGQQAQGRVLVKTVQDVIGGPLRPAVDAPAPRPLAPGENGVRNGHLEESDGPDPRCWTAAGFGNNNRSHSIAAGMEGSRGLQVSITDYRDGDGKHVLAQDLGECSVPVEPGRRYSVRTWYKSDARAQFSLYFRDREGRWHYWTASSLLPQSSEFRQGSWTTPPVPDGATALSFGLGLVSNGTLVTDNYALYDADGAPAPDKGGEHLGEAPAGPGSTTGTEHINHDG